jgi:EmrB/QacA subfamily drug resistance transporter
MRPPCDEAVIRSGASTSPCAARTQAWILAATIIASSMAFIDSTVVNVALPALQANFHATVADVQWVVESYGLLLAALILVGGSLGDIYGRRLIFLLGVVIFAAASAGCGLATSIDQLLIARSIQGIGAALLVPGSLAIISTSFDQKSRGAAIGTWSGFTAIMTALGPVLGGWLVQHASWRWVFFINLPHAAIVIVISLIHIPESRAAVRGHLDWLGALLVTVGLAGLVNGIIASESTGFTQPQVWISLVVGCSCLILFLFVEATAQAPMVPLAIFRSSSFSGANLLTLALYAAIGIFFFLFPLDLIQVQKYSATATGAAMLPLILLIFLLSRWSGGLVARHGSRLPLVTGPLVAASGFLLFAVPSSGGNYWTSFFPAIIVLGLGMAITVAPLTTVVMSAVSEDRAGTASGINNAVARVASVLAIAVLGVVMIQAFAMHLNQSLAHLSLPSQALKDLQTNEIKLAGLEPPAGLAPATQAAITQSIAAAFIFGFRIVMAICGFLSAAGSAIAWLVIPNSSRSPS